MNVIFFLEIKNKTILFSFRFNGHFTTLQTLKKYIENEIVYSVKYKKKNWILNATNIPKMRPSEFKKIKMRPKK